MPGSSKSIGANQSGSKQFLDTLIGVGVLPDNGLVRQAPTLKKFDGGVAAFRATSGELETASGSKEDAALAKKLRTRLSKSTGTEISKKDTQYLINRLKGAEDIGPRVQQLMLHLLEHAQLDDPADWQSMFAAMRRTDDPSLRAVFTPDKIVNSLHDLAGKFTKYDKLGAREAQKLVALGLVHGIPSIDVRRALENIRRIYPTTKEANGVLATAIRDTPLAPKKPWTFFFYLSSENNLESYAVADLNAMENHFKDIAQFANVVVLADGGIVSDEDESLGPLPAKNWTAQSRMLLIEGDEGPGDGAIVSKEVPIPEDSKLGKLLEAGKGELNLGKGATMKAALDFVQDSLDSDNFFLSIWSHGVAWKGVAEDTGPGAEEEESDLLRPTELVHALKDTKRPVDVMGFDACLMANGGVSHLLGEMGVKYLIGSEELLDATGWGYDNVFQGFSKTHAKDSSLTPKDLAHSLVDHANGTTLSAVKLASAPAIWSKLDALGQALNAIGGRKNEDVQAFIEQLPRYGSYGEDASEEDKALGDEEVVDIIHMCKELEKTFSDTPIATAAKALRQTTDKATHHKNQPSVSYPGIEDRSYGLTTYLPRDPGDFDKNYVGKGASWKSAAPAWMKLLRQKVD